MRKNKQLGKGTVEQKAKIRSRYQGIDPELLDVIPAKTEAGLYDDNVHRRVAVYARVSTDDPHQTSSYELQKNYYEDYVARQPNWELVGIYADEGISGTSVKHRDAFNRMIKECIAGKIDMIITKSVSRFSRNIVDCISTVNKLKMQSPPVGVLFENEQIFTLDNASEMRLSFVSAMAQEESHTKSTSMNASYEMRFSHGIFLTPPLLGYDQDENGRLVINEEEAKTVRLIFFAYLYGYSTAQIAELLTNLARPTKKGNTTWSSGAVLNVLQNERHCGAVLAHKTYTPNYLDHRTKKNCGERNQYRYSGDHEAIISPVDFVAVQRKISNAKYGGSGMPELHVMPEGALKGFVMINPRWASFTAEDYIAASGEVPDTIDTDTSEISIQVQTGDPDLRGFEIARTQFFGSARKVRVGNQKPVQSWYGYLISDFERVEICQKYGIPFKVSKINFRSEIEIVAQICKRELSERILPSGMRRYLIGKLYEAEKVIAAHRVAGTDIHKEKLYRGLSRTKNPTDVSLIHIRERLGSRYNLNQATITRYAIYSEGIDNIFHEDPRRAEQILSGDVHVPVDVVRSYTVSACAENSAGKSAQPVSESLPTGPSVKDMPEFDPDAEINSLALTIPSWVQSLKRIRSTVKMPLITDEGRQHLRDELHRLISTASRLDSTLEVKKNEL